MVGLIVNDELKLNCTARKKLTKEEVSSGQYSLLIAGAFSEPPGV